MAAVIRRYEELVLSLPSDWADARIQEQIDQLHRSGNKKYIVLDDDPTGVQTVHDIVVLTEWNQELIREALRLPDPVFFILTNSRGHIAAEAENRIREIVDTVYQVAQEEGIEVGFISRSDSTLRGHYPLETDVITETISQLSGQVHDAHFLIPAFFEAGRYTYQNVHYLYENDKLVPVSETEFARDSTFGFSSEHMFDWVEEKTNQRFKADSCRSISTELLREGPDAIERMLLQLEGNTPVIVNAMSYADLYVFSVAALRAEAKGKQFLYRTAASFLKAFFAIADKPLLTGDSLAVPEAKGRGGIVIVGSHVQKTTRQLERLLERVNAVSVEMDVTSLLDPNKCEEEIGMAAGLANSCIDSGSHVIVYSSRKLMTGKGQEDDLQISRHISNCLIEVVKSLRITPRFVIAKGGITSSDVATKGLSIRKAKVIGQAAAGIPVWLTGDESKFPGLPYVVFPGNVGTDTTLAEIVQGIIESS